MGMSEMSEAMEFQRHEDEAAMAAAIALKQYCENRDCDECVFWQPFTEEKAGFCCLNKVPWDTPTKPFIQNFNRRYNSKFEA